MHQRVRRGRGRSFSFVAAALLGVVIAACTAATATPATSLNALKPSVPNSTAAPELTASATFSLSTATPTPTQTSVALASLGPLPTGRWTSIHWTQVTTLPVLAQAQATVGDKGDVSIFGWSRGYVAFDEVRDGPNGAAVTEIHTFSSADGVNWTSGARLTYGYPVYISGVVEGPAGLLAVAMFVPGPGSGPPNVALVWGSPAGIPGRQAMPSVAPQTSATL